MKGEFAILGRIGAVAQGVGAVSSGWVDASKFGDFMAAIHAGILGTAATLDAKIEQATTSGGAGVKDVTGAAITQLVKATDDSKDAFIFLRSESLDVNGNFKFIRLTLTVAAASSLVSAELYGLNPRYTPVTHGASFQQEVFI